MIDLQAYAKAASVFISRGFMPTGQEGNTINLVAPAGIKSDEELNMIARQVTVEIAIVSNYSLGLEVKCRQVSDAEFLTYLNEMCKKYNDGRLTEQSILPFMRFVLANSKEMLRNA